ncbi:MAG: polysaccharide lyase [Myxococcota bacterium]
MDRTLLRTLWFVAFLGSISISIPASANWVEIFEDGFESGEISRDRWNPQVANQEEGIVLAEASQGDPVRTGEFAVRFRLAVTDPADDHGKRRSELRPRRSQAEQAYFADFGRLYRYEFSIRLPEDWSPDVPEVVAQWHGVIDLDSEGNPLEPRRSPPISLRMTFIETPPESGQYIPAWDARVRWDANAYTDFDMSTVTSMNLIDPMDATDDLGVWVDWVFEVRWDWHPDGVGEARVYKDGVLMADYHGPNAFNDEVGPNSKIGLYKWDWAEAGVVLRVAHYDDVRILAEAEEIPIGPWPVLLAVSLLIVALVTTRRMLAAP